uniref:Uncharacterized protein n=1 Tax=Arcella intermedia TaxID=1963864 RepID=A0A6B2LX75_9EUKA
MIGNKCDLDVERKVSTQEGKELAELFEMMFFETSSKNATNVEEAFSHLAAAIKLIFEE